MTSPKTVDLLRPERHDWKAEASGLAFMICMIHDRYMFSKLRGGDSELLASSVIQAFAYVDGPLRELM